MTTAASSATSSAIALHPLLAQRSSPVAFSSAPVPEAEERALFEAARWAASAFNVQPWRFVIARHADRAQHDKMVACLVDGNRPWAQHAGLLMLTTVETHFSHNGKPNAYARHDLGLAMAQLTVQASAMGLVVHQMAGILPDVARETWQIPAGFEPVTCVAIGYPGDLATFDEALQQRQAAPRSRRDLADQVFAGGWETSAWGDRAEEG